MNAFITLLFCLSQPSFANETAEAERVRLSEEMGTLAARGQWVAVERKYQQIVALKKVELKYTDHMMGAQAASGMGNIALSYERVQKALGVEDRPEGQQWKADIEASYARVSIKTSKKSASVQLKPDKMPFIPEQQLAIQKASKQLAATGVFEGLLPLGDYSAGSVSFSLNPTTSSIQQTLAVVVKGQGTAVVAVDTSNKQKTSSGAPVGPWVSVGGSFLQAGTAELSNASVASQSGFNGQAGAGIQLKLNSKARLGMMVSFEAAKLAEQELELLNPQLKRYQAWLPLGLSPSDETTYWVGPTYFIASTATTGTLTSDQPQPVAFEGLSGGLGGQLGYQRQIFTLGQKIGGGIMVTSGIEHDGQRLYSWGKLAFTLTPQFKEKGKS